MSDLKDKAGAWQGREPGVRTASPPKMLLRQKELLLRLKGLLEHQVDQDKVKLVELQETVHRLKHGGGR